VIGEQLLEELLGRLGSVLGDLLECAIRGCKDSVVCFGAIEKVDEIWELVDSCGELGSVLALCNELVDGHVRLAVVRRVVWTTSIGSASVRRASVGRSVEEVELVVCRFEPCFACESILKLLTILRGGVQCVVNSFLKLVLHGVCGMLESLFKIFPDPLGAGDVVPEWMGSIVLGFGGQCIEGTLVTEVWDDEGRGSGCQAENGKCLHC